MGLHPRFAGGPSPELPLAIARWRRYRLELDPACFHIFAGANIPVLDRWRDRGKNVRRAMRAGVVLPIESYFRVVPTGQTVNQMRFGA